MAELGIVQAEDGNEAVVKRTGVGDIEIFREPARVRRAPGVGVAVDESRHHKAAGRVDFDVNVALVLVLDAVFDDEVAALVHLWVSAAGPDSVRTNNGNGCSLCHCFEPPYCLCL